MSKQLEAKENIGGGTTMFGKQQKPAWYAGKQIGAEVKTADAALKLASLNWKVKEEPLFTKGNKEVDDIPVIGNKEPRHKALVRETDSKILGVAKNSYQVIQNKEVFEFAEEILHNTNARFSTAGEYYGGQNIYTVIDFDDGMDINGDKISKHLLITSSHDRSTSFQVMFIPQRVACCNMLTGVMRNAENKQTIRHTHNYHARMQEARRAILEATNYYQRIQKQFKQMAEKEFTDTEFKTLLRQIFPYKLDEKNNPTNKKRIDKKRAEAFKLWQHSSTMQQLDKTAWRAYNTITEWVDYFKGSRKSKNATASDLELKRRVLGNNKEKVTALNAVNEMTGIAN